MKKLLVERKHRGTSGLVRRNSQTDLNNDTNRGEKKVLNDWGEGNRRLLCKANGGPQPKCMMLFYTSRTGASVSKDQKIDTPRCNVYDLTTISNV